MAASRSVSHLWSCCSHQSHTYGRGVATRVIEVSDEPAIISFYIPLLCNDYVMYRGADKSLARPSSRCILFDGENISFDASLVIYINKY